MQFYICEKLNCAHEEMTVLDITLTEIGPGDLRLEEVVPLLGQAQTVLLVVATQGLSPLAWKDLADYPAMSYLFVTNKNPHANKLS